MLNDFPKLLGILFCLIASNSSYAAKFTLPKEVYSGSSTVTECRVGKTDYCVTHLGWKAKFWSGGEFGSLSLVIWSGTDEYASPTGMCTLRGEELTAFGEKQYAPTIQFDGFKRSDDFTACVWKDEEAIKFIQISLKPQKVYFNEPTFKGKERDSVWFTTDDGPVDQWLASFIQHTDVSSKRIAKHVSTDWMHREIATIVPIAYGKMLAKYKWYSDID